nr:YwiC-like family protein [Kribbella antibiotica]
MTALRPARYCRAAIVWMPICIVAGAFVLVARLWLTWVLTAYAVLFGVNLRQAWAHRERSLTNDLVLVA